MSYDTCVCNYCAFADCCPSAYFNFPQRCSDLKDMRLSKLKTEEMVGNNNAE